MSGGLVAGLALAGVAVVGGGAYLLTRRPSGSQPMYQAAEAASDPSTLADIAALGGLALPYIGRGIVAGGKAIYGAGKFAQTTILTGGLNIAAPAAAKAAGKALSATGHVVGKLKFW
ncbi:MAG: hypothetical protein PHR30_18490 [Gallionellaceae bacterium]|nr:hypothetical protein [Gallionellaceae bacterium]